MEVRHMRALIAVAEELNFTRAARRLNMAQSPLSQLIRSLEREIGVPLFARTTRSVSLTHAGEVLCQRLVEVLALADDAVDAARKAALGQLGHISIGFTGSATHELLPPLARAYADRYPEVTLEVHSDLTTPAQVERLLNGQLDVAVLRPPIRVNGLAVETIRHEPVVVLLANRHPRTVNRDIDLADLRNEWFISLPNNPPATMYSVMMTACQAAGFIPKVRQTVADTTSLVALVTGDMGVALAPASMRHLTTSGATFRPLRAPDVTVSLALAYRESDVTPLIRQFLDTARTVVRSRAAAEPPSLTTPYEDSRYSIGF
jgi:DNA-binding transcriptional LysR family regulator